MCEIVCRLCIVKSFELDVVDVSANVIVVVSCVMLLTGDVDGGMDWVYVNELLWWCKG